jgi:hypothetical protein
LLRVFSDERSDGEVESIHILRRLLVCDTREVISLFDRRRLEEQMLKMITLLPMSGVSEFSDLLLKLRRGAGRDCEAVVSEVCVYAVCSESEKSSEYS